MLVLSRKNQQTIRIGDAINITVVRIKGNTVRLGIEAPEDVKIVRGELPDFEKEETPAKQPQDEAPVAYEVHQFRVRGSDDSGLSSETQRPAPTPRIAGNDSIVAALSLPRPR